MLNSLSVIILIGPNGAGKTRIGELLERRFHCVFVDIEHYFLTQYDGNAVKFRSDQARAYQAFELYLREVISKFDAPIVFEQVGISDFEQKLVSVLQRDYAALLVEVVANIDTCLDRVKSREQSSNFPKDEERLMRVQHLYREFARQHYVFAFSINNEGLNDEQICRLFEPSLVRRPQAG